MLSLCDGLVYAELGAALPGSGGPYVYLREAYRPFGLGRLMAFVFIFQLMLVAPLSVAGGAVGFADYLGFYWTTMTPLEHTLVAAGVCVAMTTLLYRDIASVGRLAVVMLVVVLATVGWVIVAGLFSFSWAHLPRARGRRLRDLRPLYRCLISVAMMRASRATRARGKTGNEKRPLLFRRAAVRSFNFSVFSFQLLPVLAPPAFRMPSVTMPTFSTPAPLAASITATISR